MDGVSPSSLAQTTILCILQLLNSILASSVGASVSSVSVRKQTCVDRITVHHFTSMGSQDPTRSLSLSVASESKFLFRVSSEARRPMQHEQRR